MAQAMLSIENDAKLIRKNALGISELLTLFKNEHPTSEIPFRPVGGDLFIFRSKAEKKNDWRADGHNWVNQGSKKPLPRSNPQYLKSYFYIKTVNGKSDKRFRREVYFPLNDPDSVAVVHYIGDASLSKKNPHGNAKNEKPFFRTKPSVIKELETRPEIEKAHRIYKDMVCENTDGHDAVSKPRNVKQVHNVRASRKEETRLSRDAIYNTHDIAYEGGFVHLISTFPDLTVVVGSNTIIEELNTIIKLKDPDFLLSYDTTFSLGEFYVSPLVFKNVLFEKNPLIAGLFLIHERKLQETHDVFFKKLGTLVKPLKGLPIVTDMEAAIVKSIKENTQLNQIGCWRHMRQDVQRWLTDHLPKIDRNSYVNDLYDILRSKKRENCMSIIEEKRGHWDQQFVRYFEKIIVPKLEYFCLWSIDGKCTYHEQNGITTNQSEGFNFLLKDFQNWKEVPLDSLLMSLKLIQGFYEEECRRGRAGLGNFTLKSKYMQFRTETENFESRNLVCHPRDIVASIKNKEFVVDTHFDLPIRNEFAANSKMIRAKELVAKDLISFSSKLGAFTVMDTTAIHVVKIYPNEICSCPIKKSCIHILGVKLGLRMNVDDKELEPLNLGLVRKQVRGPNKQKPGRKRPRPGDVSPERKKEKIQEQHPQQEEYAEQEYPEQDYLEQRTREVSPDRKKDRVIVIEERERPTEENMDQEEYSEQAYPEQKEYPEQEYPEQKEYPEQEYPEQKEYLEQEYPEQDEYPEQEYPEKADEEITSEEEKIQQLSDLLKELSADKSVLSLFLKQNNDISFENVVSTSTPKSDIKKDIRYSLEVWIPADKVRLFHNLNINERKILKSNQWLNDIIIDSAMNLLQYQFPDLEGFQSCTLAHQLDFQRHTKLFIQIINRSPNDDSAFTDLPHTEEMVIASLADTQADKLDVKFSNVAQQTNGYDCGIYAIANATALAYGKNPSTQIYVPRMMREHLFVCLENKSLKPFPISGSQRRRQSIKKTITVPLYCTCKMPDTRTLYVYCDVCANEFHPECVGLDKSIHESTSFTCPNCQI